MDGENQKTSPAKMIKPKPLRIAKYENNTTFVKYFEGHGDFVGKIVDFDPKSGLYKVYYAEDDDTEELYEREITKLLREEQKKKTPKKRAKKSPSKPASSTKKKKRKVKPKKESFGTITSRSGRAIKQVSYNDDDDESDLYESSSEDEVISPPPKKKRRVSGTTKSPSKKSPAKRSPSRKGSAKKSPSKKSAAKKSPNKKTTTKKRKGKAKRNSGDDGDSDVSMEYDDDDVSIDESVASSDEEIVQPKKRGRGKKSVATKGKEAPTGRGRGGGKKMFEAYEPLNAPVYPKMSLEEIAKTKTYLDPGGLEATDDIIDRIVGDQVTKLGSLLVKALQDTRSIGSTKKPLKLGTACSGTDAPALALTLIQEQLEQRLAQTDTFAFSHEFSCENDPFKQAYLARNFNSHLYPDISKLCDEEPRDVYGQVQPLPPINLFVAGTSCKNFSMMRANKRIDIEERGCSGETFLAAVEYLLKEKPQLCILENVKSAPWPKMSEYISGRIKLSDCDSKKSIGATPASKGNKRTDLVFIWDSKEKKIVVDEVPPFYGVQCGATVQGYLKGVKGKIYPIQWPKGKSKKQCTLKDLIKANKISKESDTLVFDRPVTYYTHWVNVDTKDYGLPQTRQRTYMFVWQPTAANESQDYFIPDNLGLYWEALVHYLQSPVKHSLEAFLLQADHDSIRTFREALQGAPGRETKRSIFLDPDFWTSTNANLPHNKTARERNGIEDMARFITNWGPFGKKKIPPHYWLEYVDCNNQRQIDMIDILHAAAARDAETHDSNYASFYWNISQNVSREKHRTATPGIAGCITPGGDFLLPHMGRPVLGCEKLLIQGIPYFRLLLGNETEVQCSDLAGNAMSLSVVCATMLASMVAPKLREEMEVKDGITDITVASIYKYLEKNCTEEEQESRKWKGEIPTGTMDTTLSTSSLERTPQDKNSLSFFEDLLQLAPEAVTSSIWCTCESSGSRSRTNKFLRCKICGVSCCRNCISDHNGYNLDTHDTKEVVIGAENGVEISNDPRSAGQFEAKLRSIVPSSLYLAKDGIDKIADVANDKYRIRGLDKFSFGLHRIKRDRAKWLIIYYARDNNGLGEAIAEMRITLGEIRRAQELEPNALGLRSELTCFMPARSEPLQYGKLYPCCQIVLLHGDDSSSSAVWKVKLEESKGTMGLRGEGETPSHRVEVGLTKEAEVAMKQRCKSNTGKKDYEAAAARGESRRFLYAKNWEKWPLSIDIHGIDENDRILGEYHRANCRQTTNQSALWIKQVDESQPKEKQSSVFLLLKPNVSRTGGDNAIITTSMNYEDTSCILAELEQVWQPCDAFDASLETQGAVYHSWQDIVDFKCMVPASKIEVKTLDDDENNLVIVSGLGQTEISMLSRSESSALQEENNGNSRFILNVSSGQQAQQLVRVINSTVVAPILKFAATGGLKYDLRPDAEWKRLPRNDNMPFGFCNETVPIRPKENWKYDEERERWERTSDPGASREYFQALQRAQKAFEFWLDKNKGVLEVKMFPVVAAHHAASQLLRDRGVVLPSDPHGGVNVTFRLSDVSQQIDPKIDRFKVSNCTSLDPTSVEFKAPHKLYDRQQKVVTKMVAIEDGKTNFTELEMAEFNMPGSASFSLIAKAERARTVCGGVIADAIGAGKTVISIAIILKGIEKARASRMAPMKSSATLVVVPPALIDQWKSEIDKFSSLKVIAIYDMDSLARTSIYDLIMSDVVVIPVDILESKGYLENLVTKAGLSVHAKDLPRLPPYSGQLEQNAARGVWIPDTSTDPYAGGNNSNNQNRRNQSAYYTYIYQKSIDAIRGMRFSPEDEGVPLEYFEWERVFVDEIHESLCTTRVEINTAKERDKERDSAAGVGFFKEKNRRAGRELLGISQSDLSRRPLVCRQAIFGLTGTPLLDSNSRVIELANLMGGTYVIGLSSHWRKLERESCRDIFLHNYLEPRPSREIRRNIYEKCQDYLKVACCRNKSGEEMDGISLNEEILTVRMTQEEKDLYLKSQKGIPGDKQSLSIQPTDFDPSAGHDISSFLRQNAKCASRGAKLVEICNNILAKNPTTKIVVFTDGRIGAGIAARDSLCADGGPGCTWLDQNDPVQLKNQKIAWYQNGDATEEDRKRPRVLVLHFEHAAGLNLQSECHNLILYTPLYIGNGGTSGDPVSDTSTELQAMGRVYRAGQKEPIVNVYRIELQGPEGEECLDGMLIRRNKDEATIAMATNAGED